MGIVDSLKDNLIAMLRFHYNAIKGSLVLPWMVSDYDWIKAGRRREHILVYGLCKPKTPCELRQCLGLQPNSKVTSTIEAMVRRRVAYRPVSGIIALPPRGQRLRMRCAKERGMEYRYTQPHLDWRSYVWVCAGRQRRILLDALKTEATIAADIIRRARAPTKKELEDLRKLCREDAYKILHQFAERGLAVVERRGRSVLFSIRRKGQMIRHQIHLAWLMFFAFL